jgi:MerR family transcriptional regulator, copper efflux regulator
LKAYRDVVTNQPDAPAIACTLGPAEMPDRLAAWQGALDSVIGREPIDGGLRLALPADRSVAELVELTVAEHRCCSFFAFAITVDARGLALEVTAPDEGQDLVHALFGTAAPNEPASGA